MSKNSPGPWILKRHAMNHQTLSRNGSGLIADIHIDADAALIAAAPELLAALHAIIEEAGPAFGNDDKPGTINKMSRLARVAVARATGADL